MGPFSRLQLMLLEKRRDCRKPPTNQKSPLRFCFFSPFFFYRFSCGFSRDNFESFLRRGGGDETLDKEKKKLGRLMFHTRGRQRRHKCRHSAGN